MPITHGFNITASAGLVNLPSQLVVAIVGTSLTGTTALSLITSESQLVATYGASTTTETLTRNTLILQRYGAGKVVTARAAIGGDATATAANVATTLATIPTAWSALGVRPDVIISPGFNSDAVIAAGIAAAKACGALYIAGFSPATTVASVVTTRGTSVGLGTKDPYFIPVFPVLQQTANPSVTEALSTHLAGVIARLDYKSGYGASPSNQTLLGVNAPDVTLNLSYTDEAADSEVLNDLGVVTINRSFDGSSLVTWGNRNSSYNATTNFTDVFTYIAVMRVRNRLVRLLNERAAKFVSQPSNAATARLLQESFNSLLSSQSALKPGSYATFREADSNYNLGQLFYNIQAGVYVPVEYVGIDSYISLDLNVQI